MEPTTLVSVEAYLTTSYHPDREYVDGVVLERHVGEWDHAKLQMSFSAYLYNRRQEWGIQVVPEQRVQVKPKRCRVPDICVVTGPEPREQILTRPPFICIEILSRDDRMSEMQERIDDYLAFGVPHVWVLDPRTRRAYIHEPQGSREAKDHILRTESPDITVPLDQVFGKG